MPQKSSLHVAERCRVVIDNDWSGDPDGLVALAHHLLSPANRVVAVTSSLISPMFQAPTSAADGARLAEELIALMSLPLPPRVWAGSEGSFADARGVETPSAAADAIVVEARRTDVLPLFLVCGGPLTNVAQALRHAQDIAAKFTLVWIGGTVDPAAPEYNRDTDPDAAEFVLGHAELSVLQFPAETYRRCTYSVAELEHDLGGSGLLGAWLWERFVALPIPDFIELADNWPLGDSPSVLITALSDLSSAYDEVPAVPGRAERRVYRDIDFRLIVGDMLAKLRLHERRGPGARRLA